MTSVVLINPKYPHNVGGAFRACAAFGADNLYVTGRRAEWSDSGKGNRLPREERMRVYKDKVALTRTEKPFDCTQGSVVVAVEVSPPADPLPHLEHPDDATYVFGPEDGSLTRAENGLCHRFIIIPSD